MNSNRLTALSQSTSSNLTAAKPPPAVAALRWSLVVLTAILVVRPARVNAEVTLPKVLGDNMVLQREQPVPIWGHAKAGEEVAVRFAGQEKHATADADGRWSVRLDPLEASAEPREMTVAASNTVRLGGVLVGEVWLCSGQSNMEMAVAIGAKPNAPIAVKTDAALAEDVKGEGFPGIRLFRAEKVIQPPDVVSAGWTECRGDAVAKFSAIGYLFARELRRELGVPIGMMQAAWGGTRIEVWTPPEAYAQLPAFGKETASQPLMIDGVAPGKNYRGMVRPLMPFALRGVLWYQGESNVIECNDGLRYADKMEALVTSWRKDWNRADLPFFYVQIAPLAYSKRTREDKLAHPETALPELWEAQARALKIPHTGMVPTTDLVDDPREIHPQQKRPVAERLARLALAEVYGRTKLIHTGPVFDKMETRGNQAIVRFRQTGSALKIRDGQTLSRFEIAGADGTFVPAQAVIDGDHVVVSAPQVSAPTIVRFGWSETAQPNLSNAEGWPAFPFRSDGPAWSPQPTK